MRVLLAGPELEALRAQLEAAAPGVACIAVVSAAEGEGHLGRVDVAIVGGRVTPAYAAAPGRRHACVPIRARRS